MVCGKADYKASQCLASEFAVLASDFCKPLYVSFKCCCIVLTVLSSQFF